MSKFKVLTLLLAVALTLAYSSESSSFHTVNPFTVAILQDRILCTVSREKNVYKINRIRTYDASQAGECELVVDPTSEVIVGRFKAAAVYRKIVVWGKRTEELLNNGSSRRTTYTVLLVDPFRCTHYSLPDLVDEWFDINGGKLSPSGQLQFDIVAASPFYLREIESAKRYVYIYNYGKRSAVMRLLGSTFKDYWTSSIDMGGTVSELVTSFTYTGDEATYVGMIRALPQSPRRPFLMVYNEELRLMYSATIPLLDYHTLGSASIVIDTRGNAFVTLYQISDRSKKVTIVTVNKKGHILRDVEIAELDSHQDYEVQSFYDEENHCFAVHELSQRVTNVTCARVKNLYKNDSAETKCTQN